jgi:hypothetical protein
MSTTTYEKLYLQRCYNGVPHFWNPQDLTTEPYTVFGDDDFPVQEDWGVDTAIKKTIALALQLEMPVGEWVGDFTRKEGERVSPIAQTLLKSNIKDETFHFRGFQKAAQAYPISDKIMQESAYIGDRWLSDPSHTIAKACFAETGVFLISLAILRLLGGKELANLAEQVSVDESRHVATNRGILVDLGESCTTPTFSLIGLIRDTLDWVCDGLNVPGDVLGEDFNFNRDFLLASSDELIQHGTAKQLNELMSFAVHSLPFEVSNEALYTRSVA